MNSIFDFMDIKVKALQESYFLINKILAPFHQKGSLRQGEKISNPFLSKRQKTPSFNIYKSSKGDWRFKDFATGDNGDVFSLVMQLKNLSFREALDFLKNELILK